MEPYNRQSPILTNSTSLAKKDYSLGIQSHWADLKIIINNTNWNRYYFKASCPQLSTTNNHDTKLLCLPCCHTSSSSSSASESSLPVSYREIKIDEKQIFCQKFSFRQNLVISIYKVNNWLQMSKSAGCTHFELQEPGNNRSVERTSMSYKKGCGKNVTTHEQHKWFGLRL